MILMIMKKDLMKLNEFFENIVLYFDNINIII